MYAEQVALLYVGGTGVAQNTAEAARLYQKSTSTHAAHANIVRLHERDLGDCELPQNVILEWVEGEDLRERVQRSGPLSALDATDRCSVSGALGELLLHREPRVVVHDAPQGYVGSECAVRGWRVLEFVCGHLFDDVDEGAFVSLDHPAEPEDDVAVEISDPS